MGETKIEIETEVDLILEVQDIGIAPGQDLRVVIQKEKDPKVVIAMTQEKGEEAEVDQEVEVDHVMTTNPLRLLIRIATTDRSVSHSLRGILDKLRLCLLVGLILEIRLIFPQA